NDCAVSVASRYTRSRRTFTSISRNANGSRRARSCGGWVINALLGSANSSAAAGLLVVHLPVHPVGQLFPQRRGLILVARDQVDDGDCPVETMDVRVHEIALAVRRRGDVTARLVRLVHGHTVGLRRIRAALVRWRVAERLCESTELRRSLIPGGEPRGFESDSSDGALSRKEREVDVLCGRCAFWPPALLALEAVRLEVWNQVSGSEPFVR